MHGSSTQIIIISWIASILLCFTNTLPAQQPSLHHYDVKDGLAGSVVYGISQDNDGFLWFATETGLSRFDGRSFRNFTSNDGLPSNEVFLAFADSRNRVWIITFKNAACYYYNGRIYNRENDKALRDIRFDSPILGYSETTAGDILMLLGNKSVCVLPGDARRKAYWLDDREQYPEAFRKNFRLKRCTQMIPFLYLDSVLRNRFNRQDTLWNCSTIFRENAPPDYAFTTRNGIMVMPGGDASRSYYIALTVAELIGHGFVFFAGKYLALLHRKGGVKLVDVGTGQPAEGYFPQTRVHDMFRDQEGNTWFSTDGSGIYKLHGTEMMHYTFGSSAQPESVCHIYRNGGKLTALARYGRLWELSRDSGGDLVYKAKRSTFRKGGFMPQEGVLVQLGNLSSTELFKPPPFNSALKTFYRYGDTALLTTPSDVMRVKLPQFRILDTIWRRRERATCALKKDATYYIGALDGLYVLKALPGGRFRTQKLALSGNRISTMALGPDSILWVGSSGGGITGLRNDRIVARVTEAEGQLSSNICLSLFVSGRYLWAGTAKGINKIDLSARPRRVVAHYGYQDGLLSGVVNALLVEGDTIYAGTQSGLSIFNERSMPRHGYCNIALTGISVSGRNMDLALPALTLPRKDNNIRFEFSGISFLSEGHITYSYRLLGLSDKWQTTSEQMVGFPTLPPGSYTFQVRAANKFGDRSRLIEQKFTIEPALWERKLVQVAVAGILIIITGFLFQRRMAGTRRKEREKYEVQKKLADMKHTALRAQMNPHFIFNCLNSIQHFVARSDARAANFYITSFASLVRSTLDNATLPYIPLPKEVAYLRSYLELERMQLTPAFRYTINVTPDLDRLQLHLPNMIIQPFLENAVKHGVQHLGSAGRISVDFSLDEAGRRIVCTISDNGPGILRPQEGAGSRPPAHRSRGMALTEERIQALNQLPGNEEGITVQKRWSFPDHDPPYGTCIILSFPV